jgi:hypothetical protein
VVARLAWLGFFNNSSTALDREKISLPPRIPRYCDPENMCSFGSPNEAKAGLSIVPKITKASRRTILNSQDMAQLLLCSDFVGKGVVRSVWCYVRPNSFLLLCFDR